MQTVPDTARCYRDQFRIDLLLRRRLGSWRLDVSLWPPVTKNVTNGLKRKVKVGGKTRAGREGT